MPVRLDFSKLSLMDALDLAILIEYEAYERYKMFASQLGHRTAGDPASVFAFMADNEAKHGQQLEERRKSLFGDAPRKVTLDDLFDVEAPDMGSPRATMTPLQALEIALSSEQKAYDFYDYALEHVQDDDIRKLFTELRDEETEHVRMVKKAMDALPEDANVGRELDPDDAPYL